MPNSKTRPNAEVQAQRLATMRERYGVLALVFHRDIAGQRFGRLVALERVAAKGGRTIWAFQCDCGAKIHRRLSHAASGRTTSCGCARRERTIERFTRHGAAVKHALTPEYISWLAMKARCCNVKHRHFANYGGRGIRVCRRWRDDFAAFLADMGPRPRGMSIDRIDGTKGYERGNCRWATRKQQAQNRRH